MPVARSDQCSSRRNKVTVFSFFDLNLAQLIQPLREGGRKHFWHTLDYGDAWRIFRHCGENLSKGLCTPGGSADSDNPSRGNIWSLMPRLRGSGLTHRKIRWEKRATDTCSCRCPYHIREHQPGLVEKISESEFRLGNDAYCAFFQRTQSCLRSAPCNSGADYGRYRVCGHNLA